MAVKNDTETNNGPVNLAVTPGTVTSYVSLEPKQGSTDNASKFMQADAAPGLDQSIAPQWSAAHTFLKGINFGATPAASFTLDGASLKYAVTSATSLHEFYVGGKLAGQIDSPSNPQTDNSLVSKQYVDAHGGNPTSLKYLAFSADSGQAAASSGSNSIALGGDAYDQGQNYVLSIGLTLASSGVIQRRIINVADGKASNEAATLGQLQSSTAPRLSTYFDSTFTGLDDGIGENGQINALENWPITSEGILRSDTNGYTVVRVAKLVKHTAAATLTFYLYLNGKQIGSVVFAPGQSEGTISLDENSQVVGGYWPLQVGDLLSLTAPHPPVAPNEPAQGLLLVLNASVIWNATSSGN